MRCRTWCPRTWPTERCTISRVSPPMGWPAKTATRPSTTKSFPRPARCPPCRSSNSEAPRGRFANRRCPMGLVARFVTLLLAAVALSGCATGYLLDNQVQSFSHLTAVPAPATYRFDRLPSQQADPAQAALEALADPALHRAGFRRDDAAPRYGIQVSARTSRMLSPYADPWDSWGGGWGMGFGGRGIGIGFGMPFGRMESPWYHRE